MNDRLNYRTHADLLGQVATSEEEANAVRRILGPDLQRELRNLRDSVCVANWLPGGGQ